MIPIHINKVLNVQSDFKRQIDLQYQNALSKLRVLKPIEEADIYYLNAVIKLFEDNTDIIIWEPKTLDWIRSPFPKIPEVVNSSGKLVKSSIKDKIITALGYKNLRTSFYPKYFREIEIKSCVYCNSQLTVTADKPNKKDLSAKFDVDHYRSKDEFPFLSICLFNLYPACAPCNRAKSKNDKIEFNLYSHDIKKVKESLYEFRISSSSKAKYLTTKDANEIEIIFHEPVYGVNKKDFDEVFHITGIYKTQVDIVEELIIKSQIYNPSYINLLKNNFSKLGLASELYKRILVGNYTESKDIHKRPMSKFMQDIARDLGIID